MKCERARRLAAEISWAQPGEAEAGLPAGGGPGSAIAPELEEHLWSCPGCRAELTELRSLRSQLRALGDRHPPDALAQRTMILVRQEQRRRRAVAPRRTHVHLRRTAAAAAAAAAIAAGGLYVAVHRPAPTASHSAVTANVAPLVMEYADFRGAQPFGDRDGMTLVRAHMEEEKQR